jgi:hypothetical protein
LTFAGYFERSSTKPRSHRRDRQEDDAANRALLRRSDEEYASFLGVFSSTGASYSRERTAGRSAAPT